MHNDAIAYVFVFMCCFDFDWECTLMRVFGHVVFSFSRLGRGYALAHACYARAEIPIALAESGT